MAVTTSWSERNKPQKRLALDLAERKEYDHI